MQRTIPTILVGGLLAGLPLIIATSSKAQVTNSINADIPHSFTVGDATLPAGKYTLRMLGNSDLQVMTIQSRDGDTGAEFLVRQSDASTTPQHTMLVFNRYGHHEFLEKIYERGNKMGVAVDEPSREESRLQKQGQQPVEHSEMEPGA